jgi:Mn2+/Fe2+ NRAMP family transporter
MINKIFNYCETLLYDWAEIIGISYELLNIIIFVIGYPLFVLFLLVIIFRQRSKIKQLTR